ncbi:putative licABCH operon regulator [compost metagenome]
MYPRIAHLLQSLLHADTPVTGEQLAAELGVTSRTVRSDIKLLHQLISSHGAEIQAMRGMGYELMISDQLAFEDWLKRQVSWASFGVIDPVDRVSFVIRTLLLTEGYVKLEDLADQMYVSKSTVQNDLKIVKHQLDAYGLQIITRPSYGLKISGEEYQLRLCMSEFFGNQVDEEGLNDAGAHRYIRLFSRDELSRVREIVIHSMRRHSLFFSDRGLDQLAIHILVAIRRIREGHPILSLPAAWMPSATSREAMAALDIAAALESSTIMSFNQSFSEEEVAYLTMHLMGTELLVEVGNTQQVAMTAIDQEYQAYVNLMIEEIEASLKLGISQDSDLAWGLSLHLKHALSRIRFGMSLTNPMLDSIKLAYPLAFQAGIIGAAVLQEQSGLDISEHEIGYIALHIGAALERLKDRAAVKKCIIVCSTGLGSARLLYQKINRHFGSRLEVIGTFGFYNLDQAPLDNIDVIISTVPLPAELPVPVVVVQTLLQSTDMQQIEKLILDLDHVPLRFLREELTFLQLDLESREDILDFLCKELESRDLVNADFRESVKQREAIASTAYGNRTAMPHPLVPQTKETFGVICTLQKPVLWGDKLVQLVCLLCVGKASQEELTSMYDTLIHVTESAELVEQLVRAETFEQLSNIFFLR